LEQDILNRADLGMEVMHERNANSHELPRMPEFAETFGDATLLAFLVSIHLIQPKYVGHKGSVN
jgi:hypothetical protein